MSDRFYVNGYQVFGNDEMFAETYKFLKSECPAAFREDGSMDDAEIKDINGLVRAISLDMYDELKTWATDDASTLISRINPERLVEPLLKQSSNVYPDPRDRIAHHPFKFYHELRYFLDDRRIATVYNLVTHLLNHGDVVIVGGDTLKIADRHKIMARYY